jgi:hypothetical protein
VTFDSPQNIPKTLIAVGTIDVLVNRRLDHPTHRDPIGLAWQGAQ